MIELVVPSASEAEAVTPTVDPTAEFSAIVFVAPLESVGVVTSNSSTSLRFTVTSAESEFPALTSSYATTSREYDESLS